VALKNVRDKKQFMYLTNQVYPEYSIGLYNAYLDATQQPHGYLTLDLTRYERGPEVSNYRIPDR